MERLKFIFLILLTATAIIIVSGCSKDSKDNNPIIPGDGGNGGNNNGSQAAFTVNGDGFSMAQLNSTEGASYYSMNDNSTYASISAKSGSDTVIILLAFSAKEEGTFQWNDSEGIAYLIVKKGNNSIGYVSSGSGITTVTEYGDVNGYIKGSFSGSVYKNQTNDPVDIDGTFSIKRIADQ